MVTTDQGTLKEHMQNNHLSTPTFKAFNQLDIDTNLPTSYKNLFTKFDEQECEGSGWVLDKILQIEVHTATLDPCKLHHTSNCRRKYNIQKELLTSKTSMTTCASYGPY